MRLYLINPRNALSALVHVSSSRFNKYAIWKPLGLLILARLTPPEWNITVIDENLGTPDYSSMPRPDLVGLTAFSSQAERAYKIAAQYRHCGVPVVMGGIHATMCLDEASERVDAVVTGEAEEIWAELLADARHGKLKRVYIGSAVDSAKIPPARHDLLPRKYAFGAIQTTRGCPLNCHFCSVAAFNGRGFRRRPIENVIEEFKLIREKRVLIADDNLIGTRKEHISYAKDLFRAMIAAGIRKRWIGQATVNMGEDEELVRLAAESGCLGLLIGFESQTDEGLTELNKKFNIRRRCDLRSLVRRLQRHGIAVYGTFIFGLDVDQAGIGQRIAEGGTDYGVDLLSANMLTPLPGTRLWETMEAQGRIVANSFPEDWQYYTFALPVASYMHLSWSDMMAEFMSCNRTFYSYPRIFRRFVGNLLRTRKVYNSLILLACNIVARRNMAVDEELLKSLDMNRGRPYAAAGSLLKPQDGRQEYCDFNVSTHHTIGPKTRLAGSPPLPKAG